MRQGTLWGCRAVFPSGLGGLMDMWTASIEPDHISTVPATAAATLAWEVYRLVLGNDNRRYRYSVVSV